MQCPKCQSQMRERERETSGGTVVMDVCPSCGGIWLDKGELESITQAEGRFYRERGGKGGGGDDDDDEGSGGQGGRGGKQGQRRGGFLGNLLDFGD